MYLCYVFELLGENENLNGMLQPIFFIATLFIQHNSGIAHLIC